MSELAVLSFRNSTVEKEYNNDRRGVYEDSLLHVKYSNYSTVQVSIVITGFMGESLFIDGAIDATLVLKFCCNRSHNHASIFTNSEVNINKLPEVLLSQFRG